jgi:CheY-like chemotaxis protein
MSIAGLPQKIAELNDRLRRAENADRAKSRFLATVSHELRTPLNGVIGMAKLLGQTGLTLEQRAYTEAILQSGDALLSLIEDLLDVAKIETGHFEARAGETEIVRFCESVVELLAAKAYDKGIGLGCHISADLPARVAIDEARVRQVLINLIGNAIKFTAEGGVLLDVFAQKGLLLFSITDSGPGLKPGDQERIFHEFEQAGETRNGAGLGLAISRKIARAMGGDILVQSEWRKGSRFMFTLPLAGTATEGTEQPLAGRNYLILSTTPHEAEGLARTLRDHGAEVLIESDNAAARRVMKARAFDAVLADTAFMDVLSLGGRKTGKAVILLTPHEKGELPEIMRLGFDAFLVRPVRSASLLRILSAEFSDPLWKAIRVPPLPHMPPLRVLIADDNEINLQLARAGLLHAGHDVTLAGDGKAALEAFRQARIEGRAFDIILMDLHMPRMDGCEAIAALRIAEATENTSPVPILVLTADEAEETHAELIRLGATGIIRKPADPAELALKVAEYACRSQAFEYAKCG